MIINQLFDTSTSTYTYLLADLESREAVLIDPVVELVERDLEQLDELGLTLRYVLETHVHADHVTGSGELRNRRASKTVVSAAAEVPCADIQADENTRLQVGDFEIEVRPTPGHTPGCATYVVHHEGRTVAFTGDTLLIGGTGRTDFQGGDASALYRSIHTQIYSLPDDTTLYPGHDYKGNTSTTVAREKRENSRISIDVSEEAFVDTMSRLDLPSPKLIDIAVPANQGCGKGVALETVNPGPKVVLEHSMQELGDLADYRIVDVRQPEEFDGPMGHIRGALSAPLGILSEVARDWSRDDRLLLVCRSGSRSYKACQYLIGQGFSNVTNLKGGMMALEARTARVAHS